MITSSRTSGILLHPTSLPGGHGIGDFGPAAFQFVDLLVKLKQTLWQMLPLGPVTIGYSPYQSPSAFAGNPLLISLQLLETEGWLLPEDSKDLPDFPQDFVPFPEVERWKMQKLKIAFKRFQQKASKEALSSCESWSKKQNYWLHDYTTFTAMKEISDGVEWNKWPTDWRFRTSDGVNSFREKYVENILFHQFVQWKFAQQWTEIKNYAHQQGIQLVGDLPIFVAYDSADVWANPELFELDQNHEPSLVAGVPPDYFSETGQRWGNPLYLWDKMKEDGYDWWKKRLKYLLEQFDVVRIDHFRGFESYWAIPATEETAVIGEWQPGPGIEFFKELKKEFEYLPIIAEDLGLITPEVAKLREASGFPGMKVLQFAFCNSDDDFLPHNYQNTNCVVYTGTHDNDTTFGWFQEISEDEKARLRVYVSKNVDENSVCYELTRLAWSSTASMALTTLQDLFSLPGECRMNLPGSFGGKNWGWRCLPEQMESLDNHWLIQLTETYARN